MLERSVKVLIEHREGLILDREESRLRMWLNSLSGEVVSELGFIFWG